MKNSPAVGQCVRTHEGQHMPSDVTCEPPEIQSQNRVVNCEVPWSSPSYYLVQHPVNIKKKKKTSLNNEKEFVLTNTTTHTQKYATAHNLEHFMNYTSNTVLSSGCFWRSNLHKITNSSCTKPLRKPPNYSRSPVYCEGTFKALTLTPAPTPKI